MEPVGENLEQCGVCGGLIYRVKIRRGVAGWFHSNGVKFVHEAAPNGSDAEVATQPSQGDTK